MILNEDRQAIYGNRGKSIFTNKSCTSIQSDIAVLSRTVVLATLIGLDLVAASVDCYRCTECKIQYHRYVLE